MVGGTTTAVIAMMNPEVMMAIYTMATHSNNFDNEINAYSEIMAVQNEALKRTKR
jgi:hypothetical protein